MWSFTLHLGGVSSEAPEEKEGELVTGTQGLPVLTHTHLSARVAFSTAGRRQLRLVWPRPVLATHLWFHLHLPGMYPLQVPGLSAQPVCLGPQAGHWFFSMSPNFSLASL